MREETERIILEVHKEFNLCPVHFRKKDRRSLWKAHPPQHHLQSPVKERIYEEEETEEMGSL